MSYNNIPQEMKSLPQWVGFLRTPAKNGKMNKLPVNPHSLYGASSTNPETWGRFSDALSAIGKPCRVGQSEGIVEGIGFVFAPPYCGIDLDNVIDESGELNHYALDIVKNMESYTEISPSGKGLHIIYKGSVHPEWKKKTVDALGEGTDLEMYQTGRYFTVTGNILENYKELADRDAVAECVQIAYMNKSSEPLHSSKVDGTKFQEKNSGVSCDSDEHYTIRPVTAVEDKDDKDIIRLAEKNKSFESLYSGYISGYGSDRSRADMALCSILAFYTKNTAQIDRIFRTSGLMRDKWDRKTGNTTYGALTIENALNTVTGHYDPDYYKNTAKEKYTVTIGQNNNKPFRITIPQFDFETELRFHALNPIQTAAFFADCIGEYALFVPENNCYMIWNGTYWQEDKNDLIIRKLAKIFIENCLKAVPPPIPIPDDASEEEAKEIKNKNKNYKNYKDYYHNFTYYHGRINLIKDMQDILHKSINEFNTNLYLFNCQNGTFNLQTGQLQKHDHKDYLFMVSNVAYNPSARCERFERFIDEITDGDREKARYLQKAIGYCLDGFPKEECFFLALGLSTRNGKGTLFNTVMHLFGDYGQTIGFDTLARKGAKDGSRATPDLAKLFGARMVLANEPDKGIYFDEALLKQLTGGDPVAVRQLYKPPFTFFPQFRIWVTANNKPNVSDTSVFESDRLKLISFDHHFNEQERDPNLKSTLKEAASAVFNWLIEGYRLYQAEGLKNYKEMNDMLRQYQQDSDIIQQFINDRLIFDNTIPQKDAVTIKTIRCEYINWCRIQGISPISSRTFKEELIKHKVSVVIHHNQEKVLCRIVNRCIDE